MPKIVAAFICWVFIALLFWLDRDEEAENTRALWLSFVWVGLACSRSAGEWLNLGSPIDAGALQMEGSPIDRTVYSVLLVSGLIVLIFRAQTVRRLLWANASIVIFLLYCAVSLLWSEFPDVAFKRWLKEIGDLVMVLIVLTEADPPKAVRQLLKRVSFVLMPLSILLIKYYPEYGRTYGRWAGEVHYTGVTTHKNSLGAICMLFGLATLWHMFALYRHHGQVGRKRRLIANGTVLAIILWLSSMADSMTSWCCLVMGSIIVISMQLRWLARNRRLLHLIIPAMLLVCVAVLFLGVSPSALTAMGKNPTLTDRTAMWPLLLSLCKSPWIGAGFGSFWLGPRLAQIWRVWEWKPNEAHNGYLEIYLNLGWTGVTLLAIVVAAGYRKAFIACQRNRHLGSLMIAYFVVGIAYNFTEAAFFQILAPVWIMLLLAMLAHSARISPKIGDLPLTRTSRRDRDFEDLIPSVAGVSPATVEEVV